ncbi:MAG: site-specific DNA-methyltransferase [Candidatus Pacebacteria bacterium]|nr:site-specific DNA-methyltransferase [Candidatus Paceibacterota bacterium]
MTKEEKFYKALEDIFIGAKIEGEGGFVNLMRIKSSYYSQIKEHLEKDVNESLKKYPDFRDELFEKLYSFFSRYFSRSGSIYFNYTPIYQNVYDKVYEEENIKYQPQDKSVKLEKVYSDDKDVMLFWKTNMLYYVKSDRIFKNLEVAFNNYKFFFDVSKLEYKKANEKRSLVYQFKNIRKDGTIVFEIFYSEKGKVTKIDEIKKELKKKNIKIKDEDLEKAFQTFEKQSEVDYFINKNAKQFLKEQFKLWLYQYVYAEESEWPKERVDQLQILKDIAYKIIDFIAQFEDELVKIWNKPKFVKNSNYVITLDRIVSKKGGIEVIEKIQKHENFKEQIKEWLELGILEKDPENLFENTLQGKRLKKEYEHLPIDTKYFKDLELEILNLFDNLDKSLDGWLIKSENYQALNTILPKFKGEVQTIYIDPPFNKESDADYLYNVKYKDSTWASMLENRISLAKDLLNKKGSIFVRCDYNGNWIVRPIMDEIFKPENFRNELSVSRISKQDPKVRRFNTATDSLYLFSKSENFYFKLLFKKLAKVKGERWHAMDSQGQGQSLYIFGYLFEPPRKRHWTYGQDKIRELENQQKIRLICKNCGYRHTNGIWKGCPKCGNRDKVRAEYLLPPTEEKQIDSNWTDIPGYSSNWDFQTENAEILLKRVIDSTSNEGDLVIDFFLGSGTTTAVAHKLGRKWIGVEMGEYFYSVVLPRMKKVLAYDKSGISKDVKEYQGGGFFKYYELEQYEETLNKLKFKDGYKDSDLFEVQNQSPYEQYIFMKDKKLTDALEIDYENNKVKVDLSKIYPNIDIAETLSNLKGKYIKRITPDEVEFENGDKINLKDLDYKLIKPLIWW